MTVLRAFRLSVLFAGAVGCVAAPTVRRVYDGHAIDGRAIAPEAYAAFLHGVLAESSGDLRGALRDYQRAARLDDRAEETWARIGAVRCAIDARDRRADDALDRAASIDPDYPGAWRARARCAELRGDIAASRAAAEHAVAVERETGGAKRFAFIPSADTPSDPAAREAIVRLTMTSPDVAAASRALVAWAESHDDVALWARALAMGARLGAEARERAARAAAEIAGLGRTEDARAVASAAVDASSEPLGCADCDLARRLAVDDAIARNDRALLDGRAARARVPLEEVAARALLAGYPKVARAIATSVASADPRSVGAELVLDALDGVDPSRAPVTGTPASAAAWIAWGQGTARAHGDVSVATLPIPHAAIVPGDDLVERLAAELGARGAFGEAALSPDARVELQALAAGVAATAEPPSAARRAPTPATPGEWAAREIPELSGAKALDPKHEYLALVMARPGAPETVALGERLSRIAPRDRIVATGVALAGLAAGRAVDPAAPRALLSIDPKDALLAVTAFRLATRVGDADAARQAKATFSALAGRGGSLRE